MGCCEIETRAAIVVWVTLRGWLGPIDAFQKEKITPECYHTQMNFGSSTDMREMSMTVICSVCKFEGAQTQTRIAHGGHASLACAVILTILLLRTTYHFNYSS